jgi:hypothetical protein
MIIRLLIILMLIPSIVFGYTPPKGIPNPSASFSTFGEIDQATPTWAAHCPHWVDETPAVNSEADGDAHNCYYIDNTQSSPGACTDTSNTYGYPGHARCTPPEGLLAAGSYVYIHAGTYAAGDSDGDRFDWHGAGTASNPIWITGQIANNRCTGSGTPSTCCTGVGTGTCANPKFTDKVEIGLAGAASYIIFENFEVNHIEGLMVLSYYDYNLDHIIIRYNHVYGTGTNSDSVGILIGSGSGTDNYPNATISYVVVYNNNVHNIGTSTGQWDTGDQGGIYGSFHTSYLWVLDNTISNISGDCIGGCHYCNSYDSNKYLHHYFIGRNTMTNTGEDCIDVKNSQYVIISENECYDTPGEGHGGGIILHYGGAEGIPYRDTYVLYNKISGQNVGIAVSAGQDIHIVGNIIYDITDLNDEVDVLDGACFGFRGTIGSFYVVDNTCYNYTKGVAVQQGSLGAGDSMKIHGNIFSTRNDANGYEIEIGSGDEGYVDMDYNRFYASIEANNFSWAGSDHTLAEIQGHSECEHCTAGDPSFKSTIASSADFLKLNTGSECIGANVEGPVGATVYDAFYSAWSLSIEKDYAGTARPQETTWDIGAYEYDPATVRPVVSIGAGAGVSIGSGATMTLY